MLKGKGPYIILMLGILLMSYLEFTKPAPLDWSPTYSKNDKIPYGAFVLHELLATIFPSEQLETNKTSLYNDDEVDQNIEQNHLANNSNFILIADNLDSNFGSKIMDKYEFEALLNYAAEGNNVFLAANNFSNFIKDTLQFEIKFVGSFDFFLPKKDSLNIIKRKEITSSKIQFVDETNVYHINKKYKTNIIDSIKNKAANILIECDSQAILVKIPFGEGNFFISSTPKFYSNYFLLKNDSIDLNNYKITEKTFAFLPDRKTYWDEHYKFKEMSSLSQKGPLSFVLAQKSLKWALFTILFSLLIFVFVKGKRMQSVIPIVKPEKNLDVDFANTIGVLYLNEGNNIDLARKKIIYWKEKVRSRYSLNTNKLDETFEQKLNAKSNLDQKEIFKLVFAINAIEKASQISNGQLIHFNKQLENFYDKI